MIRWNKIVPELEVRIGLAGLTLAETNDRFLDEKAVLELFVWLCDRMTDLNFVGEPYTFQMMAPFHFFLFVGAFDLRALLSQEGEMWAQF